MLRILLAMLSLLVFWSAADAQNLGRFTGNLIFRWNDDGRTMKLLAPYGFLDPSGRAWDVPSGAETDGASIPKVLWSVVGGPYEGKYRNAAVVHDYYCQVKSRPWRETHLVFYQGMLAVGIENKQAKLMYAAVYYFGPRWGFGAASRGPGAIGQSPEQQKATLIAMDNWIKRDNPDLPTIEHNLDSGQVPSP